MNCDNNHQNMIGVCLYCKSNFCEQCLVKHKKHLNRILLASNLLYLFVQANIQCLDIQESALQTFRYDSKIILHLDYYITMLKNCIYATLNNQITTFSIEVYQSVIEKLYIREFIQNLKKESILSETNKNQIISLLIQEISKDDYMYLMIKYSDFYYLLLKLGLFRDAQWLFDHYLQKLQNKSIFFHNFQYEMMKQSKINNKINLEAYEQIQTGRNFYIVGEYEKCISFMDILLENHPQYITHDQANIFRGLSLFLLGQFPQALRSFQNVQNKDLIIFKLFLCKFFSRVKGITLERMKDFDNALKVYSQYSAETPLSRFQKSLCYLLFKYEKVDRLKYYCDSLLKINEQSFDKYLPLGVLEIQKTNIGHQSKIIAENLIKLKPNRYEGYILKCACIIINNELHQTDEYIESFIQKFQKLPIFFFVCSIVLFFRGEFDKSYQTLSKVDKSFFENPLDKLQIQIIYLMNKYDYREAFLKLVEKQENSQLFYLIVIQEYCFALNEFNLNKEAFHYIHQEEQNLQDCKFINILLGNQNLKFSGKILFELKRYEEALSYFNEYPHESSALAYIYFYQGLTLLKLNRLEDAADFFECALITEPSFLIIPFNFYFYKIVIEIMFGRFEKAQQLNELQKNYHFTKNKFLKGFIYWIQGHSDQAEQILKLKELTDEFPLINLVLSWIFEEKKIKTAATIFLDQVYQHQPELKKFKTKYSFLTNGPYSKFIERNKIQFDSYDDRKFFNIKFMALFIETYDYDQFQRNLYANLTLNLNIQLINQVHRQDQQKQDQIIKSYPFV